MSTERNRLFAKHGKGLLPQQRSRFPFLYLEHGRLEVDDSSLQWIGVDGAAVRIPAATVTSLLLGPGSTVTHAAVRVAASVNCVLSWVGDDSTIFYAHGHTSTSDSRNMRQQLLLASDPDSHIRVCRNMFSHRFSSDAVESKSLDELRGMEGVRVRNTYAKFADYYGVTWGGRLIKTGNISQSDMTNRLLTIANSYLYGIVTSSIYGLGFSPHIGFIHTGSPLPFVYDIADLYKEKQCIDLAFGMTSQLLGKYNKLLFLNAFIQRAIESNLLTSLSNDLMTLMECK
jgi:CRISPR-associated protein Cas1